MLDPFGTRQSFRYRAASERISRPTSGEFQMKVSNYSVGDRFSGSITKLVMHSLCALNLGLIEVAATGPDGQPAMRVLQFDRCADCPQVR
jgi:hypothetical protein